MSEKAVVNPYRKKPGHCFWRKSIAGRAPTEIDPIVSVPFQIGPNDRIATAGSCFAQHIARTLKAKGFDYFVTETGPASPGAVDENYGLFPARFGNIYTVRQLLQLLQRAYGLFEPVDRFWLSAKGTYIDPFRPTIQADGFATIEDLEADLVVHLAAVRKLFEQSDILVFTLGLTEGWRAVDDGAVFPIAPGTISPRIEPDLYEFHNFSVAEMNADLQQFVDLLRRINPTVKIILTVSPVALIATYEDRHVLVSNTYSKAALRVVAEDISRTNDLICYFPSYEIINTPTARFDFFQEDLRDVRPEGVDRVMSLFCKHFLGDSTAPAVPERQDAPSDAEIARQMSVIETMQSVVCDEELLAT